MEFINIVLEKTGHFLKRYNLQIIEQRKNYLKIRSKYLVIAIHYNQFENSYNLWFVKNGERFSTMEIDNTVLAGFFHSKLRLSEVPRDVFINNLVLFFENEGQPLLEEDTLLINELEKFCSERSEKYNQDLIERQKLNALNASWENKDYQKFIRIMEQIDRSRLRPSYELKYKIAKKKE